MVSMMNSLIYALFSPKFENLWFMAITQASLKTFVPKMARIFGVRQISSVIKTCTKPGIIEVVEFIYVT